LAFFRERLVRPVLLEQRPAFQGHDVDDMVHVPSRRRLKGVPRIVGTGSVVCGFLESCPLLQLDVNLAVCRRAQLLHGCVPRGVGVRVLSACVLRQDVMVLRPRDGRVVFLHARAGKCLCVQCLSLVHHPRFLSGRVRCTCRMARCTPW